jgi:hypothetical protein
MIDFDRLTHVRYVETVRGRRRLVLGIEPGRNSITIHNEVIDEASGTWEMRGGFVLVPQHAQANLLEAIAALVEVA